MKMRPVCVSRAALSAGEASGLWNWRTCADPSRLPVRFPENVKGCVGLHHSNPLKWVCRGREGSDPERVFFGVGVAREEAESAAVSNVAQAPEEYHRTEREHRSPGRGGFARPHFFRNQPQDEGKAQTEAEQHEEQRIE